MRRERRAKLLRKTREFIVNELEAFEVVNEDLAADRDRWRGVAEELAVALDLMGYEDGFGDRQHEALAKFTAAKEGK